MKRRVMAFILSMVLVLGLSTTAGAFTVKQERAADALYHLELFLGRSTVKKEFDLDSGLSRAEGVLLLVRMLGAEEASKAYDVASTPFTDLVDFWPNMNKGFIAYSYQTSLVKGMTDTTFGPAVAMNDQMFLTLVLRQLGYTDGDVKNYVWDNANRLAFEAGLVTSSQKDAEFTRGDAVLIFWKAMEAKFKGTNETLAKRLISEGVFTTAEYQEAKQIFQYGYILGDQTDDDNSGNSGNSGSSGTGTTDPGSSTPSVPEDDGLTDYEKYNAMTGAEQMEFINSFDSIEDFFDWLHQAEAEYEAAHPDIEIGDDGVVDLTGKG